MFDAACDSDSRVGHGAPVENLQAPQYAKGERKANIIFRLVFAQGNGGIPTKDQPITCSRSNNLQVKPEVSTLASPRMLPPYPTQHLAIAINAHEKRHLLSSA
jgi:hypothetical protein